MRLGIGCMRLSTRPDRDESRAAEVIRIALDGGIRLLDTSDAYALDKAESGHNERLIRDALPAWDGDAAQVEIVTKGGLTRPDGRWVPDGRAKHLRAACEASLESLGLDRLPVYLLHAPDPKTPLSTSVRALARLKRAGLVGAIGLSNVTVDQIEEAMRIAPMDVIQVPLSPFDDRFFRNGVSALCAREGIRLMAHSPLGGPRHAHRIARDPLLARLAAERDATPYEIALAWLVDLHPTILPIPGPTRPDTVRSVLRATELELDDEARETLDERFRAAAALRTAPASIPSRSSAHIEPEAGEVVVLMGIQGAGKSTAAERLVERGYLRLNRDVRGGRLRDLIPELEAALDGGRRRIVLDNTYGSRAERNRVIEAATRHGAPVRCLWLDTPVEEAQINAVLRMIHKHGALLSPEDMKARRRDDPGLFGPSAQFRYRRALEPPSPDEGFSAVERVEFQRVWPGPRDGRALIVECDGVLRRSRSGERSPVDPADVALVAGAREALARWRADGYRLLALAWHPDADRDAVIVSKVRRVMDRTIDLLGIELDWSFCPHPAGPPVCWCRKPLPGLVVPFVERYRLDPASCVVVGPSTADRTLARRMGMRYMPPDAFLADDPTSPRSDAST